ncbi:MAG: hypothetical protein LUQ04_11075 [Methanoregula sp.]|nr:hypothetical protein [Methanoregula sp.]
MQQALTQYPSHHSSIDVLPIPRAVYNAFHPYDKLAVQALEKVGKVRVVDDNELKTI